MSFIISMPVPERGFRIGLAMKNKRLNKHSGWPDLFIGESKKRDLFSKESNCNGLFIELKISSPFLKDGKTLKILTKLNYSNGKEKK